MKRLLAAAFPIAALMFGASSAQAFGGPGSVSCAAGSVDGSAPTTPMCFGTMFPQLAPFSYSDQAAADLAATMQNQHVDPAGADTRNHR